MESEAADGMWNVTKRGRYGGQPANLVCIFDPAAAPAANLVAHTYDKMMALKEGVLFARHVSAKSSETRGKGLVYLQDLRAS